MRLGLVRFSDSPEHDATSRVAYHFKVLEKGDAIELIEKRKRRGASEHIYRGKALVYFSSSDFARLSAEKRRGLTKAALQGFSARTATSVTLGTFDSRPNRHLTWQAMVLDEIGFNEMMDCLDDTLARQQEILARASARRAKNPEDAVPTTVGLFGYESPPVPPAVIEQANQVASPALVHPLRAPGPSDVSLVSGEMSVDKTVLSCLGHPMRTRVLEVLNEYPLSPVQFVRLGLAGSGWKSLQHALSHVSYHFRELEKEGAIEKIEERDVRGASESIYVGKALIFLSSEDFETMPVEVRAGLTQAALQGFFARTEGAVSCGTFDSRTNRHLTWQAMVLDRSGFDEMMDCLDDALPRQQEIIASSSERLEVGASEPIRTTVGLFGYESPPLPTVARPD